MFFWLQDNNASAAGVGMVASWILALIVAASTLIVMIGACNGKRMLVNLQTMAKLAALFCLGIVIATTVSGRGSGNPFSCRCSGKLASGV